VRSPGVVTFNSIGHREHSFDGAFPQLFGWLLQSGQVFGGERFRQASRSFKNGICTRQLIAVPGFLFTVAIRFLRFAISSNR
jgi:hypothetical protein